MSLPKFQPPTFDGPLPLNESPDSSPLSSPSHQSVVEPESEARVAEGRAEWGKENVPAEYQSQAIGLPPPPQRMPRPRPMDLDLKAVQEETLLVIDDGAKSTCSSYSFSDSDSGLELLLPDASLITRSADSPLDPKLWSPFQLTPFDDLSVSASSLSLETPRRSRFAWA